ncbi:disease resistance protein Pik-2-like [Panicum virgatum]|uniref:Uncharacterized protein n=1 Tax=Panicum virgatum TaxID=38727 RepID=A0A8T0PCV4_PANVG|nr:disease resistance protein Pik-2-like [Panicum virgatum]KAG2558795.1 hypothetical protein PVAP13_8NG340700 [Panicum virgatum]
MGALSVSVVVDAVMRKLGALLEQEYVLLSGVRHNVRFLEAELRSMRAVIYHRESLDEQDALFWHWIDLVRELAYAVEDWVDLFTIRVDAAAGIWGNPSFRSHSQGWFRSPARKMTTLPSRRVISSELQELKKRFTEIAERRERYKQVAAPLPAKLSVVNPRLPALYQDIDRLVGLARPMEEVTKMVIESGGKAELKTVSIVGMAGSGKTTLANAVYMRLREENCFQCHAFVSVGQKPDLKKTRMHLLSMLDNVHQQLDGDITTTGLIVRLRHILEKKRYLIVVDDLWTKEHWQRIKCCFPENSLGSRIVTITRKAALAAECSSSSSDCIYNIGLLSEVDSKKLVLNGAFGCEHDDYPQHLEDVFPKIIKRCGGLPLALVTLASMLADQYSNDKWDTPIGWRWLSHPDAEQMMQTITLSYNNLPLHLRTCLLYLSTFPVNKKVDIDRLVRRWIAEEFILMGHGASVEETARIYLDELISVNMVQPLLLNKDGVMNCRLHPVIHDFLVCKSMDESFMTMVDAEHKDVPSNVSTIRRLCLQSSSMQDQDLARNGSTNLSRARSIVISQASTTPHLTDLRVVRVLDLEGYDGIVCLDGLDKLLLLRYLSLRGTNVSELPETLGELRCLQTLDVRSTKVKQLPRSILRLQHTLMALLVGGEEMVNSIETTRMPNDIWQLRKLENLATVDLRVQHVNFVEDLGALESLRVITITWYFHQCSDGPHCKELLSSIQKWRKLKSLTIHCGLGCSMEFLGFLSDPPQELEKFKVTVGRFAYVPAWINGLVSLYFLQITICKIGTDDLDILRTLPKLQLLILGLDFVPSEAIVIETEGFSELLTLSVNCPAPWLTFGTGAMPKLTHLQLEFCSGSAMQESVPDGIGNLQSLTEVALLYNQNWCANSSSVIRTVDAVKRQVAKHRNQINLVINETKVDVVQEVDEETESPAEIQSSNVQIQKVGEKVVRTTIETCGEIEEVEGDNFNHA